MKLLTFILGLVGGFLGAAFSMLAFIGKSYSLWWITLIISLGAIYCAWMIFKDKTRLYGAIILAIGLGGWILTSKIYMMPGFILILTGIFALLMSYGKLNFEE